MKIKISNKEYDVIVAKSDEEKERGLQNVEEMEKNEGMLFVYDEPMQLDFWMKDTDLPLDIIFINEDLIVESVQKGIPNSEDIISDFAQYVLELNSNSGITPGMEVEMEDYEDDLEMDINSMYILDSNGKSQGVLEGGERIFSRPHSKTLISIAKRAFKSKRESDYKKLGKKMFEYLKIQDEQEPEYVNK